MTKKILFINQEIAPYMPDGDISALGQQLPQKAQEAGLEIRTFTPKWGVINERKGQLHEVIRLSGMNLVVDDIDHSLIIKVASIPGPRLQVYFIDNDDYFNSRLLQADEQGNEYDDNGERSIFYARGVLETVKKLRWSPDVIICQGWISATVPFYVKTAYKEEPSFADTKVICTLYGNQLQGDLGANFKQCLPYRDGTAEMVEAYKEPFDFDELTKLAIDYSDGVMAGDKAVSEDMLAYAEEKGIPTLRHHAKDGMEAMIEFIKKICPDKE